MGGRGKEIGIEGRQTAASVKKQGRIAAALARD